MKFDLNFRKLASYFYSMTSYDLKLGLLLRVAGFFLDSSGESLFNVISHHEIKIGLIEKRRKNFFVISFPTQPQGNPGDSRCYQIPFTYNQNWFCRKKTKIRHQRYLF